VPGCVDDGMRLKEGQENYPEDHGATKEREKRTQYNHQQE